MSFKKRVKEVVLDVLIKYVSNVQSFLLNLYAEIQIRKNNLYADKFLAKFRSEREKPETVLGYSGLREKHGPRPNCPHTKGGRTRGTWHKDYNVAYHRFSDGSHKIWCLNGCGFTARPGDQNWKQALEMFESSSNKMTASEMAPPITRIPAVSKRDIVVYQDRIE
jgi:hypothetical protein